MRRPAGTLAERFWAKADRQGPDDCWEWAGGHTGRGYGAFAPALHEVYLAHRYAYELMVGPIPPGLQLDHLCRVRGCVNPAHLEPVTARENVRRAAATKTHCAQGHEFTPENTYQRPRQRVCRTCKSEGLRRLRARKAAAA